MPRWRTAVLWLVFSSFFSLFAARACADVANLDATLAISGQLDDMDQYTRHSGFLFRVGLRGLSYSGRVERVLFQESQPGRLSVWLALRDVRLTIE